VVLSANIVRMAFYLVISLAATAALFFLAGADFVGAMQLLIYVGGTLVLLIFGVMLVEDRSSREDPAGNNHGRSLGGGALLAVRLAAAPACARGSATPNGGVVHRPRHAAGHAPGWRRVDQVGTARRQSDGHVGRAAGRDRVVPGLMVLFGSRTSVG
jgi:hypothetical protein